MREAELRGVVVPVVTPTDDSDRVDEAAFRGLLQSLVKSGVHGLFIGGSAGEGPLLAFEEWRRMIRIAQDEVGDEVPLLGGAMDTSTARITGRLRELVDAGYRFGVVAPSFYVSLTTAGEHRRLFQMCSQAARGLQLVAYNIPACTLSQIPIEVLDELAREGTVQYCKDSSGDVEYLTSLTSLKESSGLKVFVGAEDCIAVALRSGAVGMVPACANFEPETFIMAYDAACAGDWVSLEHAQERIRSLRRNVVLGGASWLSGVKHAVAVKGFGTGKAVSPLEPLTEDQRNSIDLLLATK